MLFLKKYSESSHCACKCMGVGTEPHPWRNLLLPIDIAFQRRVGPLNFLCSYHGWDFFATELILCRSCACSPSLCLHLTFILPPAVTISFNLSTVSHLSKKLLPGSRFQNHRCSVANDLLASSKSGTVKIFMWEKNTSRDAGKGYLSWGCLSIITQKPTWGRRGALQLRRAQLCRIWP